MLAKYAINTHSPCIASAEQHLCVVEDAEEELRNKLHTFFTILEQSNHMIFKRAEISVDESNRP